MMDELRTMKPNIIELNFAKCWRDAIYVMLHHNDGGTFSTQLIGILTGSPNFNFLFARTNEAFTMIKCCILSPIY